MTIAHPLRPAGAAETPSSVLRGIALKVAAAGLFTVMGALVRWLGDRYPTGQMVFCRSLFALIPVLLLIFWSGGGVRVLRTERPWMHVTRALTGFAAMLCIFAALALLPLADATAIGFASPLMATALAVPFLGERVRLYRWTAVLTGFIGVVLMVQPHGDGGMAGPLLGGVLPLGAVFGLLGALCSALAMISIRRMSDTEPSLTIVFYFTATTTVLAGLTLPVAAVLPSAEDAVLLVCIGLLGGCAQLLMTNAYRLAPASTLAPFDYTAMLWALAIGYAAFGELPALPVVAGAAIVIGSGLMILIRERALGLDRSRSRTAGESIAPPAG